jgi:Protein of unknown function (DUF2711)
MIHLTPEQNVIIEKSNWPTIRSAFKDYEMTFVMLHPFLKIKPTCEIKFETGNWPTKEQILFCTEKLAWSEIINKSELNDISEIDRLLAYLHCARRTADRTAWIKLNTVLDNYNYIAAEVDYLPDILINNLVAAIGSLGYTHLLEYTEFGELKQDHAIDAILTSKERDFCGHAMIATPDNRILIATDFDQRFSYLSSTKEIIDDLIAKADLEGFFCNQTTRSDWSYNEQTENTIDWHSPERYKNYA